MARKRTLGILLLLGTIAACGGDAESSAETGAAAVAPAAPAVEPVAGGGPPPGRYDCRQGTTVLDYLTLERGGAYEVNGVRGRYRFDAASAAVEWEGGSYDEWGWEGSYDHVVRTDGRPDDDIVRLRKKADGVSVSCYRMEEE